MVTIQLEVCVGTSCHLMGASDILCTLETLQEQLRSEAIFEIGYSTCMSEGQCVKCPKVSVNGSLMEKATPDGVREAILQYLKGSLKEV